MSRAYNYKFHIKMSKSHWVVKADVRWDRDLFEELFCEELFKRGPFVPRVVTSRKWPASFMEKIGIDYFIDDFEEWLDDFLEDVWSTTIMPYGNSRLPMYQIVSIVNESNLVNIKMDGSRRAIENPDPRDTLIEYERAYMMQKAMEQYFDKVSTCQQYDDENEHPKIDWGKPPVMDLGAHNKIRL